jgi:HAE1 family hydrophobic/amphiphilic exporter-1
LNDRKQSVVEIIKERKSKSIPGANIDFASGTWYGAAGGFELRLLDKTGSGDYKKMNNNDFVKELNKRRVIECV